MKKGQVTLMIIIAIALVGVLLVFFVFKEKVGFREKPSSLEVQPIYNQLSDCIEKHSLNAIQLVGLQGGYVFLPEWYLKTDTFDIAYGYYNEKNTLVSKEDIEIYIEDYLDLLLPFCFKEEYFQNIEINLLDFQSNVDINSDSIEIIVIPLISVSEGDKTLTIDNKIEKKIEVRFEGILNEANRIIENQDSEYIDITDLSDSEFIIKILPYDRETVVYIIEDEYSRINDLNYIFQFAIKNEI